jgi:hypothetical protein
VDVLCWVDLLVSDKRSKDGGGSLGGLEDVDQERQFVEAERVGSKIASGASEWASKENDIENKGIDLGGSQKSTSFEPLKLGQAANTNQSRCVLDIADENKKNHPESSALRKGRSVPSSKRLERRKLKRFQKIIGGFRPSRRGQIAPRLPEVLRMYVTGKRKRSFRAREEDMDFAAKLERSESIELNESSNDIDEDTSERMECQDTESESNISDDDYHENTKAT